MALGQGVLTPRTRVMDNKHASDVESTNRAADTRLQSGECSHRRPDSVRRFNVGRVLVLNNPPTLDDGHHGVDAAGQRVNQARALRVLNQVRADTLGYGAAQAGETAL